MAIQKENVSIDVQDIIELLHSGSLGLRKMILATALFKRSIMH